LRSILTSLKKQEERDSWT